MLHLASMGPSTLIDGDADGFRPTRRDRRFNGAVDSHRRRHWRHQGVRPRRRGASMGASTLNDGDGRVDFRAGTVSQLQWGRRLSSTETPLFKDGGSMSTKLQWGRRLSSTETGDPGVTLAAPSPASMGPSTLIDGDARSGSGWRLSVAALQWGRRLSSTETNGGRYAYTSKVRLQWGRRLSSTETRQKQRGVVVLLVRLQWGRRLSSTETRETRTATAILWPASMGPSTLIDGDARDRPPAQGVPRASMGPSTLIDGDR